MASREEDNRSMRSCKSGILEYMILSINLNQRWCDQKLKQTFTVFVW
jgi:hypothetical protein